MRNLTFALACTATLFGCDPVMDLDVTIEVPSETRAAWTKDFPAQVVIAYDAKKSSTPSFRRVGYVCAGVGPTLTYHDTQGGVGCASETTIDAWLLPVPAGEAFDCASTDVRIVQVDPGSEPPWASGVAFGGLEESCETHSDRVTLVLKPPTQD